MKKFSFFKIASLALVCVMLLGAFMFTALATDEPTVAIVSNNVYYGDTYHLMFAVDAPEGATFSATCGEDKLTVAKYEQKAVVGGVEYDAYIIKEGIAAQAIDTVVTFTVAYGEETATVNYSVLQYVYERMYVSANKAEGAELAMFKALLTYADAASIFFNTTDDDETNNDKNIADLVYVNATDCTFDGKTAGMVEAGETVKFVSSITAGAGKVINFEVTNILTGSTTTISAASMAESGYVVNGPVSVAAVEADADEVIKQFKLVTSEDQITDGEYIIIVSGQNKALSHYDAGGWVLSATPTVNDDVVTDTADAVWTLTVTSSGVTLTDKNSKSIKPKSGNNNGIQTGSYNWTLVWNGDGTVSFKGTGSDTTTFALNAQEGKFRAYKNTTVSGNAKSYPSTFLIYKLS